MSRVIAKDDARRMRRIEFAKRPTKRRRGDDYRSLNALNDGWFPFEGIGPRVKGGFSDDSEVAFILGERQRMLREQHEREALVEECVAAGYVEARSVTSTTGCAPFATEIALLDLQASYAFREEPWPRKFCEPLR